MGCLIDQMEPVIDLDERGALRRRTLRESVEPRLLPHGVLACSLGQVQQDRRRSPSDLVGKVAVTAPGLEGDASAETTKWSATP